MKNVLCTFYLSFENDSLCDLHLIFGILLYEPSSLKFFEGRFPISWERNFKQMMKLTLEKKPDGLDLIDTR